MSPESSQASSGAHLDGPNPELRRDHPLERSQKSYHTVLEQEITRAEEELERPSSALFLSALSAGLDLGFGAFLVAAVMTLAAPHYSPATVDLLSANAYTIGFIFVIIGRTELFTEHTTSALLPVLARRGTMSQLARLWSIVLVANLIGGAVFAAAASYLGPALGIIEPRIFGELAHRMVDHSFGLIVVSGIAAGWLMGLLTWLVTAARETISQIFIVWITTFVIGFAHLHHSVAGSIEVLLGVFSGEGATMADFSRFLGGSVLGNAIGGVVFVALLKYAHVRQSH